MISFAHSPASKDSGRRHAPGPPSEGRFLSFGYNYRRVGSERHGRTRGYSLLPASSGSELPPISWTPERLVFKRQHDDAIRAQGGTGSRERGSARAA